MSGLSKKLLEADIDLEVKMVEELEKLKAISDKLPFQVRTLLDLQENIDGSIYYNGFLDDLGIVIPHITSLQVQEELKGVKALIDEIMNYENTNSEDYIRHKGKIGEICIGCSGEKCPGQKNCDEHIPF